MAINKFDDDMGGVKRKKSFDSTPGGGGTASKNEGTLSDVAKAAGAAIAAADPTTTANNQRLVQPIAREPGVKIFAGVALTMLGLPGQGAKFVKSGIDEQRARRAKFDAEPARTYAPSNDPIRPRNTLGAIDDADPSGVNDGRLRARQPKGRSLGSRFLDWLLHRKTVEAAPAMSGAPSHRLGPPRAPSRQC